MALSVEMKLAFSVLYRQRLPPGQLNPSLQERLNAPLGALSAARRPNGMAGPAPAQAAPMRAGESAEELRLREERQERERAAQRKREAEAKRKTEVRSRGLAYMSRRGRKALIGVMDHIWCHLQSWGMLSTQEHQRLSLLAMCVGEDLLAELAACPANEALPKRGHLCRS